jgi:hypothetical protein
MYDQEFTEKMIKNTGRSLTEISKLVNEKPSLVDVKFDVHHLTPVVYHAKEKVVQLVAKDRVMFMHPNALYQLYGKSHFPASAEFRNNIELDTMQRVINDLWKNVICRVPKRGEKKKLLLRMNQDTDEIIAFLSERYNPYDNKDMMSSVEGGFSNVKWEKFVTHFYCDDYKLGMRIVFPGHAFKDPQGRVLWPALFVRNDETGNGAVHVNQSIFNVRTFSGLISLRHFQAQKAYHTRKYQDIVTVARKACGDIPDFTRKFIDDMTKAHQVFLPEFDIKELQEYLGSISVKKDEVKEILEYFIYIVNRDGVQARNKWTLSQAISYASRLFPYDRQMELEQLATKLLVRKY